jgi:uncharacterized protein
MSLVPCPRCGELVVWSTGNKFRPFCSDRCKTVDLGAWASEAYRVPAEEMEDEVPPEAES